MVLKNKIFKMIFCIFKSVYSSWTCHQFDLPLNCVHSFIWIYPKESEKISFVLTGITHRKFCLRLAFIWRFWNHLLLYCIKWAQNFINIEWLILRDHLGINPFISSWWDEDLDKVSNWLNITYSINDKAQSEFSSITCSEFFLTNTAHLKTISKSFFNHRN